MKCKSCGANYKTKNLTCPYCGETNILGLHWKQEEDAAAENYRKTKMDVLRSAPFYVVDQILNRILLVMGVLVAIVFVISKVEEPISEWKNEHKRAQVDVSRMEELYQAGSYQELYEYMVEYCVYNEKEYAKYSQYISMNRAMNDFINERIEFVTTPQEKFEEYSGYGEAYEAIDACYKILRHDWYPYSCREVLPENEELYEQMCLEVNAFLTGELEMTAEEITMLKEGELIYTDAWDDFYHSIYERKGWKYGE